MSRFKLWPSAFSALFSVVVIGCVDAPANLTSPSPRPRATSASDPAPGESFNDGFEASSLNTFWATSASFGTVSLSSAQAHAGLQSVAFASVGGGQRDIDLRHVFASPVKGNFSVYFYDAAPGQETLYELFYLESSVQPGLHAHMGIMDYDANCYVAWFGNAIGHADGPNQACGVYPQTSTTNVHRTAGWHLFEIKVAAGTVSIEIDGQVVFTANGDYRFDTVVMHVSGPDFRPNTIAYYDDFSYTPLAGPAYQFSGFFNPVSNLPMVNVAKAGSAIPLKFGLGGDQGLSVLAPGSPTSTSIACDTGAPTSLADEAVSAGGSGLSYDAASQTYTYVWKTDKSWKNSCRQLNLKLTDGTEHLANFSFK